jgi:hypothetical protein
MGKVGSVFLLPLIVGGIWAAEPGLSQGDGEPEECISRREIPARMHSRLGEIPRQIRCEHPARIRQILLLRHRYEETFRDAGPSGEGAVQRGRLKRQAARLARPILRQAFLRRIRCVEEARTSGQKRRCDLRYWRLMDTLALTGRLELESRGLHGIDPEILKREERRPLTAEERERELSWLRERLRRGALIEEGVE